MRHTDIERLAATRRARLINASREYGDTIATPRYRPASDAADDQFWANEEAKRDEREARGR